jgi:tRNA pseudouridine38-40 synthase
MPLWKLILAYDGTAFHGWQIQPQLPTVQGSLRSALREITGEEVLPQGSGRTDTGVHALGQVASFELQANIPPPNLLKALNRALPPAIRVLSAAPAPRLDPPFHARHSAQRKTYEYRIFERVPKPSPILNEAIPTDSRAPFIAPLSHAMSGTNPPRQPQDNICPPFQAPYVWDCPWHVDLTLAQRAAHDILGAHDFTSFAATDPDLSTRENGEPKTAIRTIHHSCWRRESGLLLYRVTGSGFLHHMVRNLVGTFVDIASGRTPPGAIPAILAARDRAAAGQTAPARGLFLLSVEYPAESPAHDSAESPA